MCIRDRFHIEEDIGFRKLMKWIPEYELRSRKTISPVMIQALHNKQVSFVKHTVPVSTEASSSVCISTDMWTSRNVEFHGHYIPLHRQQL